MTLHLRPWKGIPACVKSRQAFALAKIPCYGNGKTLPFDAADFSDNSGKIHLLGPDICFLLQSGLQISCLFRQILKQYNCKGCASSMIHPCQVSLGISLKSVPFLLIFSLWSYEAPCKLEFSISSAFPVSHQHLLLRFLRFWLAYHAQP